MMDEIDKQLSIIDYILFSSIFGISFIIGIASAWKGNKSPEEYFMGNRSFGPIPVAMSLLTSYFTASNVVGTAVEVYSFGTQLSLVSIGSIFGIVFSIFVVMPVIHPLRLTSINEYFDMRFQSPRLQTFMMALILLTGNVFVGVSLYATSVTLATVTPLSFTSFIFLIGVFCTSYSTIGGIRAVIWTDMFQLVVMFLGLFSLIIAGIVKTGGFYNIFAIASEGQRLQFFNMNPSLYERHNFYNTLASGVFLNGAIYSVSQINTQRLCSVATLRDAKLVLIISMIGVTVLQILMFSVGLVAYALYAGCDPLLNGQIQKRDQILSLMIVDKLRNICGLPGIFAATLLASTLSSFSSLLNSYVAIIWKDLLCKLKIFSDVKSWLSTLINQILTVLMGGLFIGMAFLTSKTESIIQLNNSVLGLTFGCIFGTFLLGMCFPTSNAKGAWSGLIVTLFLMTWIYMGSIIYGEKPEQLLYSTDQCENPSLFNITYHEIQKTNYNNTVLLNNDTERRIDKQNTSERFSFPLMYLYGMSYTLYPIIGPFITIFIGLIVSHLTCPANTNEIAPELMSPINFKFGCKNLLNKKKSYELK